MQKLKNENLYENILMPSRATQALPTLKLTQMVLEHSKQDSPKIVDF